MNRTAASNTQSVLTPAQGFPNGYLDPANINLNQLQSYHVRAMNPHSPTPQVQQWSLGFQREFGNAWTAEVNYVGTKSTHLDHLVDFNQPLIVNGVATTVPYPNFGFIEYTDATSYGNYNGLQASLNHRFNNGLNLRAAYTYSRSLDNAPEELETNSGRCTGRPQLLRMVRPQRLRYSASRLAELRVRACPSVTGNPC